MNAKPVALDPGLVARLTSNSGQVPLTDSAGNPEGYFVSPAMHASMMKAMYDQAFAEITEEEVREALADPRRHTMDEVFKLLSSPSPLAGEGSGAQHRG